MADVRAIWQTKIADFCMNTYELGFRKSSNMAMEHHFHHEICLQMLVFSHCQESGCIGRFLTQLPFEPFHNGEIFGIGTLWPGNFQVGNMLTFVDKGTFKSSLRSAWGFNLGNVTKMPGEDLRHAVEPEVFFKKMVDIRKHKETVVTVVLGCCCVDSWSFGLDTILALIKWWKK